MTESDAHDSAENPLTSGRAPRISVAELENPKEWQLALDEQGVFEIVDEAGLVGVMVSPKRFQTMCSLINSLEDECEKRRSKEKRDASDTPDVHDQELDHTSESNTAERIARFEEMFAFIDSLPHIPWTEGDSPDDDKRILGERFD